MDDLKRNGVSPSPKKEELEQEDMDEVLEQKSDDLRKNYMDQTEKLSSNLSILEKALLNLNVVLSRSRKVIEK